MGVFLSLVRDLRDEIKLFYFLTFIFMKYTAIVAIVLLTISATAFGATGDTSTGSTSTGSTSTGSSYTWSTATGVTSTGGTSTGVVVSIVSGTKGQGGPTRGFNHTTNSWDMVPQCFPWVWLLEYYKGNIFDMYQNQAICRANRLKDFGL